MAELLFKEESFKIIGICMDIHKILGMGLREINYKEQPTKHIYNVINEINNSNKYIKAISYLELLVALNRINHIKLFSIFIFSAFRIMNSNFDSESDLPKIVLKNSILKHYKILLTIEVIKI